MVRMRKWKDANSKPKDPITSVVLSKADTLTLFLSDQRQRGNGLERKTNVEKTVSKTQERFIRN